MVEWTLRLYQPRTRYGFCCPGWCTPLAQGSQCACVLFRWSRSALSGTRRVTHAERDAAPISIDAENANKHAVPGSGLRGQVAHKVVRNLAKRYETEPLCAYVH
jgi:hypothetical protein